MKIISNSFNSLLILISALLPLLFFTACNNDENLIWDIAPVNLSIHIKDADGNNMLSPAVAGNLRGKKITAEYRGEEYELNWDQDQTRAYLPVFRGLTIGMEYIQTPQGYEADPARTYMSFGEFDGAKDQDISIILRIEGYSGEWLINVTHRIKWKRGKPQISNTSTLNGQETDYSNIVITI
ncbi:MAG: hypothetical protein K2J70_05905 [Muribaculaceae bacterium]|nr:hypothetical protein [Muribaculaceae bacterium]